MVYLLDLKVLISNRTIVYSNSVVNLPAKVFFEPSLKFFCSWIEISQIYRVTISNITIGIQDCRLGLQLDYRKDSNLGVKFSKRSILLTTFKWLFLGFKHVSCRSQKIYLKQILIKYQVKQHEKKFFAVKLEPFWIYFTVQWLNATDEIVIFL